MLRCAAYVVIGLVFLFIKPYSCARVREYVGEKVATCATPNTDKYLLESPGGWNFSVDGHKFHFKGSFVVKETIQDPLELILAANRCSLDMKNCEPFNKLTLNRICHHINGREYLATFLDGIQPSFRCPIKPGVYEFKNSTMGLSFISNLPIEGYRWTASRIKEFLGEKVATCVTPNTKDYLLEFPTGWNYSIGSNKVHFYGSFVIKETIQAPIDLIIASNRCTLDMKTCEPFNKFTLPRICTYVNDENGVFASFFNSLEPNFHCPLKPGVYEFKNSTIDLRFFTNFPLEGYRWTASLKLISKDKLKKEIFCLYAQVYVRWIRKS
ncbi:uncharacterized protein LOC128740520 [Sabethes cyaneus]|uniref:uncharacterized protein LOC128740520 n=1 Tax=Sabethes cyaneus TaxID=53552 RepID=UPI00237E503F|nr:uncharacterized protein LOC128740520 [Sabethes cyaneus]